MKSLNVCIKIAQISTIFVVSIGNDLIDVGRSANT